MQPTKRPIPKVIHKTILLISGKSCDGKTFLSYQLLNENVDFVSLDMLVLSKTNIQILETKKIKMRDDLFNKFGDVNKFIVENCLGDFLNFLFDNFINKSEKNVIIIEGELLTHDLVQEEIKNKSKRKRIRIWTTKRTL